MNKENINLTKETTNSQVVTIINGAGVEPITVAWSEGMTVTSVLEAAEIELEQGETAVISDILIEKPDETLVEPGQTIIIDNMPANG